MRIVILLSGILVLVTLACSNSPKAQEQPTQPPTPVVYVPASASTTWATPEDEFGEDKLIYPIRVFQTAEFPTLKLEDPKRYVTFIKGTDGRYHGTIHGIEFILELFVHTA